VTNLKLNVTYPGEKQKKVISKSYTVTITVNLLGLNFKYKIQHSQGAAPTRDLGARAVNGYRSGSIN